MKKLMLVLATAACATVARADTLLTGVIGENTGNAVFKKNTRMVFANVAGTDGRNVMFAVELIEETENAARLKCCVGLMYNNEASREMPVQEIECNWGLETEFQFETDGQDIFAIKLTAIPSPVEVEVASQVREESI